MTEPRVSDEQIAEMVAEVEQEDVRAKAAGEAHGNYGETFGAVLFDLRDSRAANLRLVEALRDSYALMENYEFSEVQDEDGYSESYNNEDVIAWRNRARNLLAEFTEEPV